MVNNATFSGNTANRGGAIYALSEIVLANMERVTVVHNTALTATGGLDIAAGTTGALNLSNSTVAFNSAPSSAGIYIVAAWNAVLHPRNSIIIENGTGQSGIAGNLSLISQGYNIYSDQLNAVPFAQNATTDSLAQNVAAVNLSSLAFHGGTTKTMKPLPGSIAIDMGDPSDVSVAQNGLISGVRDIGAAESCNATTSAFSESACFAYTVPSGDSTYTMVGTYTVYDTISNIQGCDSLLAITITVNGAIDNSTSTTGVTITSNATGVTYQWIDCGNNSAPIAGETSASYTATTNGDYAVVVTDGNCSDTSACVSITTVGMEDNWDITNAVSVYPNPVMDLLTINTDHLSISSVSVVSLSGQMLKSTTSVTKTVDVSDLASGIYFLQVQTDQRVVSKRFIKH